MSRKEKRSELFIKILGERIREIRLKKGITKLTTSVDDISGFMIGHIERGDRDSRLSTLLKVSEALNITMADLFDNIEIELDKELLIFEETQKLRKNLN